MVITTDKSIGKFKPRAQRYAVKDSDVPGLDLRIYPDGRKLWTLRYRAHGEQRRLKLGVYGPNRMGLHAARKAANEALRKVDGGADPRAELEAAKEAAAEKKRAAERAKRDSIEALCEAFIERHAKVRKRTWRDDQSKINCEILTTWKGRPVTSITRRDCRTLVQAIADRPAPIYANRVAALLSRLFRFAVDEELIDANIAAQLPKPGVEINARPEAEREDKPSDDDEIRAVWKATTTREPAPRALYRLGLLTGQRPGEVGGMRWDELDGHWWTIPAARTKNRKEHRVYLTEQALAALEDVARVEDEPRVFVGYRGKRQIAELNAKVFTAVRQRSKPRHAMRDTVATGMAAAGVKVEDVSHVLNHSVGLRVTAGYNAYAYDKEKRLALSKWARRLTAILQSSAQPSAVVSIAG
jgi:integrase